jgi:hypothetical protein
MNSLQQLHPEVADTWDTDKWVSEYSSDLFLPKSIMRSAEDIAKLRAARAKQQQAQQALAAANSASATAKNMGDTDVGGGMNAMSLMTGLGGAQPGVGS